MAGGFTLERTWLKFVIVLVAVGSREVDPHVSLSRTNAYGFLNLQQTMGAPEEKFTLKKYKYRSH